MVRIAHGIAVAAGASGSIGIADAKPVTMMCNSPALAGDCRI
jgi:hypothetical protein